MKATKQDLEAKFLQLLETLQPEPGYMRLFREVVLEVWKERKQGTEALRQQLETVVRKKRQSLDRVEEAFLYERSIDRQSQMWRPRPDALLTVSISGVVSAA